MKKKLKAVLMSLLLAVCMPFTLFLTGCGPTPSNEIKGIKFVSPTYDDETGEDLEADFVEVIAAVEKEWLFNHMKVGGVEHPLAYLRNEYVWDDSYEWFINAKSFGKVAVIEFN